MKTPRDIPWWVVAMMTVIVVALLCGTLLLLLDSNTPQHQGGGGRLTMAPTRSAQGRTIPLIHTNLSLPPDVKLPAVTGGVAPVIYRVATKEKVVFLGIDDGAYKNQEVIDLMRQNHIKASLYLSDLFIHDNPGFFKQVAATGSVVEDHTISHDTTMSKKSFDYQKREICAMADLEEKYYGQRPVFFRPPGGAYTLTTQQAAAACGMKAVVTWIAKANGGAMQYQYGNGLHAGDVVLMHFRPEFKQDLQAFINAQNAAGLHTELLENWL